MNDVLNFENDQRTEVCDHRRVAGKLDSVAQSLVAVEQNGLARDGRIAKPHRLGELPVDKTNGLGFPAPFPRRPAAREIAEQKLQQCSVPVRVGIIRLDRDGGAKTCQRLIKKAEFGERRSPMVERQGKLWLE